MASTENTEIVSDNDDTDELATLSLIEKKDTEKSTESVVNVNLVEASKEDSCDSTNNEEMLLAGDDNKDIDSDSQGDDMELRWEDDDEIKNEEMLLGEDDSEADKMYPLSLQDEVIKSIEDEEKLLDSENDNKSEESPTDSISDGTFAPKMDHNLNKPDIMLEIPSSDDEDMTTNLEMSPDLDSDDENLNDMPVEGEEQKQHAEELGTEKEKTVADEKALEKEAQMAADILTRELNAMDGDNVAKDDNDKEHEEELVIIKDDDIKEIEVEKSKEQLIDKIEEPIEKHNNTEVNPNKEDFEDIQEMEEEIAGLCQEILKTNKKETNLNVQVLENVVIKSETSAVESTTDTDDISSDKTATVKEVEVNTKEESISEKNITSEKLKVVQVETQISIESSAISTKEKDSILNESVMNTVKESVVPDSQTSEPEITQMNSQENITTENISNDDIAKPTEMKDLSKDLETNNTDIDQSIPEVDTKLTKNDIEESSLESQDPEPSTSNTIVDKSEPIADKKSNEPNTPSMDIDDPQPSTSFAGSEPRPEQSMFGSSMVQDTSQDVPEMTDSLGLLAESSRMMEEDEEQEYDDDGEDEDDFDQDHDDESSNQMTAEHSEDSNAHHSETEVHKEADSSEKTFSFTITDVASEVSQPEAMKCDEKETTEKEAETNEMNNDLPTDGAKIEKQCEPMEIETVKLSDDDTEIDTETGEKNLLKTLLLQNDAQEPAKIEKQSPSKTLNLEIVKQDTSTILNFVDLEESSSDDDAQETKEQPQKTTELKPDEPAVDPGDETLDVKSDEKDSTTEADKEATKASPAKSILLAILAEPNEEETKPTSDGATPVGSESKPKSSLGLEVFSLDSDEEDQAKVEDEIKDEEKPIEMSEEVVKTELLKCINKSCSSDPVLEYYVADSEAIKFYDADKKKRGYVCQFCADAVEQRNQELINGIKNFTPLLELGNNRSGEDLVEISDSESEDEAELDQDQVQVIGAEGAKVAEEKLAQMINETWEKFKMDARLADTQNTLRKEIDKLQKDSAEIDQMLNECQAATDRLRGDLYATFEPHIRELPPFVIYDMPNCTYSCVEPSAQTECIPIKRNRSPSKEIPAKRPAIPLGYAPLDDKSHDESFNIKVTSEKADDDNTDVSVVKLSAEAAPKDLPPPGELTPAPVRVGMLVYAMKNAFGSWLKARVVEIMPKSANSSFTLCRVKFEHKATKNPFKVLPARCLAYYEPPEVRLTIGRRVIALFQDSGKREAYYSGIVAEIPNPVNSYRYLIFFDDGYAQYACHDQTRLVCECSCLVWEEVHPYSREFVRQYLLAYPERPMVRLHAGQNLKTEWRGKWWSSRVVRVDASLVQVQFLRRERREWVYRGSTRLAPLYLELQAAERQRPRARPRPQPQARTNMPYVEYTRSDEQADKASEPQQQPQQQQQQQQNEEMRRQRAVAKKSTTTTQQPTQPASDNLDNITSRVVYYTPKNAVKPYKMVPHTCSPKCKRTDVLALKDLRTYNPLAKPLLSGWERQIVRWKGQRGVLYVAPCGRRLRALRELHAYLRAARSDMPVDLFDFSPATHCLAEFVLNKCFVGKKDLSHGKENVPVPCVNYYDESLPEFCSYNTERTPTAGVPLNLDPAFLCGCDCDDDCEDKTKCACWKMTLEGARTIGLEGDVGYQYKRLPEPLPSGIYECNSRCKCKHTCLNRVAQHPLQLKLQVFKTLNRGWGIRALNDVPKGAFLCVYAGNLLTDATANLDGLNEGDEYLAELDYIEVVEQMKEGYEEDIPEKIKKLDKKESEQASEDTEDEEQSSEEEAGNDKTDLDDDDFQPGHIGLGVAEFNKRLRKRESKKVKADEKDKEGEKKEVEKKEEEKKESEKESNPDEECITISDDEEVREPSCFTAAAGMGANEFVSKYRSVRSLFGEDEACYIMDAKVQGNIGRYLNHSCCPNVFVQNVFVDTHDPRFPWVAFFALSHIRAGTELTWNYNYDVGSVPGKVLYCHCGAANCRGRLL